MVIMDALLISGGAYHDMKGVQYCGYAFRKTENHQFVAEGKMVYMRDDAAGFDGYIDFVDHTLTDLKNGEKIFFDKPVAV